MNPLLLRAMLAVLLLTTVGAKVSGTPASVGREQLAANVMDVLARHNIAAVAEPTPPTRSAIPPLARFDAPGCNRQVEVVPIHINLQEAPLFETVFGTEGTWQFAYLDRTWTAGSPWGMRLTWLKHKVLSWLGASSFATVTFGLLIATPPGCEPVEGIDWSGVWRVRENA